MKIVNLAKANGWECVAGDGSAAPEAENCYIGDLLSWVMAKVKESDLWLTVMGNINAVAVASLRDVAAILLVENAELDEQARTKANEAGVCIYRTSQTAYEAACAFAEQMKRKE